MTNYDLIIETLERYGVEKIFAYPGHTTIALLDAINKRGTPELIVASSEQEAICAADAYARYNGLGAVIVTFGVGSLSTTNFAVNAYVSKSPVVIISGRPTKTERQSKLVCSNTGNINSYIGAFNALGIPSFDFTSIPSFQGLIDFALHESTPVYIEIEPDTGKQPAKERILAPFATSNDSVFFKRFTQQAVEELIDPSLPGPLDMSIIKEDISDMQVVYDVGESVFAASQLATLLKNPVSQILSPVPWVSMGFALPASIGVSFATNKPVIAITGDGSFRLTMLSLTTIARYNLDVKIILIDNNGFETERFLSDDAKTANYNELNHIDYPLLVGSMGISVVDNLNTVFTGRGFPLMYILKRDKASPRMKQFCLSVIRKDIE